MVVLNEYKLFVQRIGLVGITNILLSISPLILLPVLTKSYSIDNYGIWVQVNVTIGLLPNLAGLGLPIAIMRFIPALKEKIDLQETFYSIACVVFLAGTITSTILILFSSYIASALFGGNTSIAIFTSIIVFILCLNNLFYSLFRGLHQIKLYSIFLVFQTYLNVALVSYFALNNYNILFPIIGILISQIITFLVMLIPVLKDIGFKVPRFTNLRQYLSFSLPSIPSNLSYWIVDSSDRYVIGLILGLSFVGYYSPGYALGNIVMMFFAPFITILPATISKFYDKGEITMVKTLLEYSMKYFLLMAIPAVVGLSLLSKPILTILSTPEIASNGYLVTPFVAFGALLMGISGIMSHTIIVKYNTKIIGIIWIITAIINLVLNIIFVPYYGILGAAAMTTLSYGVSFLLTTFYSLKHIKFGIDFRFILKSIFASILMSVIILTLYPRGVGGILIITVLSTLVYALGILILKGISREEIQFLKKMV